MDGSDWDTVRLAYAILRGDLVDKLELEQRFIVSIRHKTL
jgi:hypothetical protein